MGGKNIIFFGESGSGKSSLINMLLGKKVARVSSSATGCTMEYQDYPSPCGKYQYFDTAGFNEGSAGTVTSTEAITNLFKLIKSLENGVNLLIYVIKKGRITSTIEKNYELFVNAICMSKVPVLLVITHCESETTPGVWWSHEETNFLSKYNMSFKAVVSACAVEGVKGQVAEGLIPLLNQRYAATKVALEKAIIAHCMAESWSMGNWTTWLKAIFGKVWSICESVYKFATNQPQDKLMGTLRDLGVSEEDAQTICGMAATLVGAVVGKVVNNAIKK